MRPKLTWRTLRWSAGGLIEPVPAAFRQAYGDAVADAVERVRDLLRSDRDEPSTQDVKATLRALAEAPADADMTRLDTRTEALMLKQSWLTYRVHNLEALAADQVATCARAALADVRAFGGRPKTDDLALALVRDLLRLQPPDTTPTARDELLLAALLHCGFGATPENLRRLLAKAGQVF